MLPLMDEASVPIPAAADAPDDESSLLVSLRRGDEAAFAVLVRTHGPRMLAVARRYLRQEEDARDAVQEAFINAFKALGGFEADCKLGTWLHRIVVNCALMKIRSRERKPEQPIEDLLPRYKNNGHQADPAKRWSGHADRILESKQNRALVRSCIDRLPESYRNVLLLRDIEEMSTEETARLLDMTTGAVKVRLHRARQALRGLLDPHFRSGKKR
jgi:RNA polymerase sigma-70 factor (ECF subfamily)